MNDKTLNEAQDETAGAEDQKKQSQDTSSNENENNHSETMSSETAEAVTSSDDSSDSGDAGDADLDLTENDGDQVTESAPAQSAEEIPSEPSDNLDVGGNDAPVEANAVEANAVEVGDQAQSDEAQNDNPNMRWFVVQAFSGFEKQVKKSLQNHILRADRQSSFGRILVPTEEVVEMKGGQKRTSERKFFPGYVLVQMEMTDETWHLVKSVPRVAGFIGGTENRPMPISDKEANEIIQQVSDSADKPKMKFTFAPGEIVRIIDGPFQDFNGTVEDANFEKSKLKVSVTIFGRSTPVELNFTQVEKG